VPHVAGAGLEDTVDVADVIEAAASGTGSSEICVASVGPVAAVGDGVYAGGGSFMPAGRLVAGDGFVRGLGLLREASSVCANGFKSAGPRNVGVAGV